MYRAKHNLTQQQMADLLGVHCNMIHRYEKGGVNPHKVKIIQLEQKMNDLEEK